MIVDLNRKAIKISGKDALTYLENRLTGIVDDEETFQPNFALSPTGKIEGFYRVIKKKGEFYVIIESSPPEEAILSLFRFKVAENISWTELSDFKIYHASFELVPWPTGSIVGKSVRTGMWGFDIISEKNLFETMNYPTQKISESEIEFEKLRIAYGDPVFFEEVSASVSFVEIAHMYPPKKGKCYVGQEVVEKSLSIGRPPYILKRYKISETDLVSDCIVAGQNVVDLKSNLAVGKVLTYRSGHGFIRVKPGCWGVGIKTSTNIIPVIVEPETTNHQPDEYP